MLTSRRYYIHFFLPSSSLPPSLCLALFPSFLLFFSHVFVIISSTLNYIVPIFPSSLSFFSPSFCFSPPIFLHSLPHPSFSPHPFFLPPSASSPSSCMSDKYGIENKKAKGAQSQGFNVTLYSGGWQRSNSRFQETRLRSIAVRRAMPYYNT